MKANITSVLLPSRAKREHPHPTTSRGFTLVEMMVSVMILAMLITAVLASFIQYRSSLKAQRLTGEVQGNVHAALDILARDISLTGYGLDMVDSELDEWITWVSPFTSNPQIDQSGDSHILTIAAAYDRASTLSAGVADGATQITVPSGDMSHFDTSSRRLIYIGRTELARIQSISGNILTISTHPTKSVGLEFAHQANEPVEVIIVYTYQAQGDSGTLPFLERDDNTDGGVYFWLNGAVAAGIENLQVEQNGNLLSYSCRGRSLQPDHHWDDPDYGDHFRRETVSSSTYMRNK